MSGKTRVGFRLLAIAALALALGGCGGGGGGGSGGGTTGSGGGGGGSGGGVTASPGSVTASGAAGRVTISWTPVSGATSYNVYWSTSPSVSTTSGTKIAGATSPYVQTGLSNGTTYYYLVTAVSSSGESTPPPAVSATPPYSNAAMLDTQPIGTSVYPVSASINSTGTASALWGDGNTLMGNIYQSGAWASTSTLLATSVLGGATAVTPAGDAVVAYVQETGVNATTGFYAGSDLTARIYNHTTRTWSAPLVIGGSTTAGTYVFAPSVAIDGNGNAMVIWSTQTQIYAVEYTAATATWGAAPLQISAATAGVSGYALQVVVDGNNVFTAVWTQNDATGMSPYVARFNGTWSAASSIGFPATTTSHAAGDLGVAVNAAGNIAVVWGDQSSAGGALTYSVGSAQYNPVTATWSAAAPLFAPNTTFNVATPQVAVDSAGNAKAVWEQNLIASGATTVWESACNAGTWSTSVQIDQANGDSTQTPVIGMDSAGNAELVWEDFTAGRSVERHYDATTATWTAPNTTAFQGAQPLMPMLSMNAAGYGLLLGQEPTLSYPMPVDAWAYIVTP